MTHNPLVWMGLGGVAPDDNPRAHHWQHRLHWVMVTVALLAIPAYLLDASQHPAFHQISTSIDILIFGAFLVELVFMLKLSSFPWRYLFDNWLNAIIIAGAGAAIFGAGTDWVAVVRLMRAAIALLVVVRMVTETSILFTRRGAPILIGITFLTLLGAGAVFFWLDPAIENYWDGLWLAFITGTTVGYGDVVPTTGATRVFAALMVLVGVALMTLFTANVVSFFVGAEEQKAKKLNEEIAGLRAEIEHLAAGGAPSPAPTSDLQGEIALLRSEIAALRESLDAARSDR